MSKRTNNDPSSSQNKRIRELQDELSCSYNGYRVIEEGTEIDVIPVPQEADERERFFAKYVVARKPCKFRDRPGNFNWDSLQPLAIKNTLGNDKLQIEKKTSGGFGSGSKRINMNFHDFIDELRSGNTDLYLTTQYEDHEIEESFSHSDGERDGHDRHEEDEDADDDEEDEGTEPYEIIQPIDGYESETSSMGSINFNDLHDDFDDASDEPEELSGTDLNINLEELYQPPLSHLINELPEQPPFLKLIPQQINLWIGSASQHEDDQLFLKKFDPSDEKLGLGRNIPGGGSSSGLHHDHADNIYIPISGHKRFTLFSPADVAKMYTVGDVDEIFDSGIINYKRNENAPSWSKLTADGAIEELYASYKLEDPSLTAEDRSLYENLAKSADHPDILVSKHETDPPSFSKVPPTILHMDKIQDPSIKRHIEQNALKRWPNFFKANRITVDLNPGEMLYLPTGWFHEVTSFGKNNSKNNSDNIHIAVNYWMMPPTSDAIDRPYLDSYWTDYFAKQQQALNEARDL